MCQIKAEQFRRLATECERQAELADGEPMFREMQSHLAKSYSALAEAEDWLDGLTTDREAFHADNEHSIVRAA